MSAPPAISTETLLDDLGQLCRLPGSPEQDERLALVAERIAAMMRARGLQTELIADGGAPVVVGRRAGQSPFTLLLYHHYDVPPAGSWRAWHHDPFQLAERESILYGRGVADGKGPLAAHLSALDALLSTDGELPCGVVLLAEGEGLVGSPNLGHIIADSPALFRADACLSTGGERDANGRPLCYGGVKGALQLRLTAVGANQPLPPGMAAIAHNPLWRLIWALGQIKSDQEEILIGGFYDDVEGPSRDENQMIRSVALDEAGRLAAWGVGEFLFAMGGAALVRTESTLPTCNVAGLTVEPAGDLPAIPVVATARLDFQLVPRQRPQAIVELLRAHLESRGLGDIAVERLPGSYPAVHTPLRDPFVQRVRDACRQVYGAPPEWMPLGPLTQPLFFLHEALGAPMAVVACARPDSAINGPNEHIPLADLVSHAQLLVELLHICAGRAARAV